MDIQYKILVENVTGKILIVYKLQDQNVTIPESDTLIDITTFPNVVDIIDNPTAYKVLFDPAGILIVPNDIPVEQDLPLPV